MNLAARLAVPLALVTAAAVPSRLPAQVQLFPVPTKEATPTAITLGFDGNVWFTETDGNRIGRITAQGAITEFELPEEESLPGGIAAGRDGRLWFTELFTGRIGAIDAEGRITEYDLPTVFSVPIGITLGRVGAMWFTEAFSNNVGMISPNGDFIAEFHLEAAALRGMYDITLGPEGELWFTENEEPAKVGRVSSRGEFSEIRLRNPASSPFSIVAGPDGNLWVGHFDDNQVTRVTPDGKVTDFPLADPNARANKIIPGPDGNLWFSQGAEGAGGSVRGAIAQITTDGRITEFPLPVGVVAAGLTFGADGAIWFTDSNANQIGRFLPSRPGTIALVSDAFGVFESDGVATIAVQRALGSEGAIAIDYATSDDTATAGVDYSSTTGTILFTNGEAGLKSFEVQILDDSREEESESVTVTLFNPTGGARLGTLASASLIIIDDDDDDGTPPSGCSPQPTDLCLNGSRFRVEVEWRTPQGATGVGMASPLSGDTGTFWFFDSANLELVVKILDGRGINDKFWVFYGALSNVEYTIRVTDTQTGAVKEYFNPQGQFGSFADTAAFDGAGLSPTLDGSRRGRVRPLAKASATRVSVATRARGLTETLSRSVIALRDVPRGARITQAGTFGPEGMTYDFFPTFSIQGRGVSYYPASPLDFATDFRVTFDGIREDLPAYNLAGGRRPRIDESIEDLGGGRFGITFHLTSDDGGDLFPRGIRAAGEEQTDPVLSIGWLQGAKPLRWEPPHRVISGSLELKRDGSRLVLFDQPPAIFFGGAQWDGHYSTILPGYAGKGIDEVILQALLEPLPGQGCTATATALCLSSGRFRVDVEWFNRRNGTSGRGQTVPLTGDTGTFWFFDSSNTELIIKVLDARAINGRFWVFYGALSDVEYTITVTDTETGATKTYFNPNGRLGSVGDTSAF